MTKRLVLTAILAVLAAGCGGKSASGPAPTLPTRPASFHLPTSLVSFGAYQPVPLLGPAAPAYAGPPTPHSLTGVTVAPDLEKVLQNTGVSAAIEKNGFAVVPSDLKLFQYAYEGAPYGGWPVFVTTDVAYHEWHLVFDGTLREVEQQMLLPDLEQLVTGTLAAAEKQTTALAGSKLADDASRVEQLFQLAAAELGAHGKLGPLAAKERQLVDAHAGSALSPLLGTTVDYSLFTPRGHYTRTPELTRYFVAMSVLGQLPFCLPGAGDCPSADPATVGVLAARVLASSPVLVDLWKAIYEPTAFLVGTADDYTPLEVADAAAQVAPDWQSDPTTLTPETVTKVIDAVVKARPVLINPERAAIRFMGTRFVLDSYLLDQLIYPNVGTKAKPRWMPSGLDIAAAFGSQTAYSTLKAHGATAYAHYDTQLAKMRSVVAKRPPADWGSTVYDAWLYALAPMFAPHGAAFPDFMQTPAWAAKDQQSGLGSYTELKHDTLLYAKQFLAEGDATIPPNPRDWVEPDPVAFGRLVSAATLLRDGLADRKLLTKTAQSLLAEEISVFSFFERLAQDELAGRPIAKADENRLHYIGSTFEQISYDSSGRDKDGNPSPDQADAIVADIGSGPAGVLELGTGRPDWIFVLVPDDQGTFQLAVGGVYSYYEFTSPPGQRLDDAAWRSLLDKGTAPAQPAWATAITAGATQSIPEGP